MKLGKRSCSLKGGLRLAEGQLHRKEKKGLSETLIGEFLKIFRYGKKQFRCAYKNNRLTYSNFSVKALEEAKRFRSAVFVVDFEHVERTYLVCG